MYLSPNIFSFSSVGIDEANLVFTRYVVLPQSKMRVGESSRVGGTYTVMITMLDLEIEGG